MHIKYIALKQKWFQYSVCGALGYVGLLFGIYFLAFIAAPLGLRSVFEYAIGIIAFPVVRMSLFIVSHVITNPLDYGVFFVFLSVFFSVFFGAFIGLLYYVIVLLYGRL